MPSSFVSAQAQARLANPELRSLLPAFAERALQAFDQAVTGSDPAQARVRAVLDRLSPATRTAIREGATARLGTTPRPVPGVDPAGLRDLFDPPARLVPPRVDLGPNRLSFQIAFVRADRTTNQRLRDDMRLMVALDDLGRRSHGLIGPIDLGKFSDQHTETYNRTTHTVDLPEDGDAHAYLASLYLAEHDLLGGFETQVRELAGLPDKELIDEAITLAIIATPALLSILVATPGLLLGVVLLLGALLIEEVAAGAWRRLRDDVFPSRARSALISADHRRIDATDTIEETRFDGFGGTYTVGVRWILARTHDPHRRRRPPRPRTPPTEPEATRRLGEVKHIVVLMLENRSFDHMLGFLRRDGWRDDVDPDAVDVPNTYEGKTYGPTPLGETQFWDDPPHHHAATIRQVNGGKMDRFVEDFARVDPNHPERVMGYHPSHNVPVYHALAEQYAICTRWYSSQPGSTWVNRLIWLTGRRFGEVDNPHPPFFSHPSLARVLDARGVSWKVYFHDVPFLATVDPQYRLSSNFRSMEQFRQDCAAGNLPKVSWIDPNFVDIGNPSGHARHDQFSAPGAFPATANDDHPPTDIANGQALVAAIVNALASGPGWADTMFVVTYDEHGGFYDHVPPPELKEGEYDDDEVFPQEGSKFLGVRVPALVVSPRVVPRSVSTMQFDHTSVAKTILTAFCREDGTIPDVGKRVAAANHLGFLLDELPFAPAPVALLDGIVSRVLQRRAATARQDPRAGQPTELTTLMREAMAGIGRPLPPR